MSRIEVQTQVELIESALARRSRKFTDVRRAATAALIDIIDNGSASVAFCPVRLSPVTTA